MKKPEVSIPVFRHAKRSEWGAALLTWERGGKRGYLFEDGVHRMIASPYYHMMAPIQLEQSALSSAFQQQIAQMSLAKARGVLDPTRDASTVFSFDEQAQLLLGQFPKGFAGDKWRKRHRGEGAKKRLKRHRDAAVEEARGVLSSQRLAEAVADHRYGPQWEAICSLLEGTDLVPPRDIKALRQRLSRADRGVTQALASVLHAEQDADAFGRHFTALVTELTQMLGSTPSWPLVTSFLVLSSPSEHFCVHPTSLSRQREWLGDHPIRSRKPNVIDYQKALGTAADLGAQLDQMGLDPKDLLDVYDFIRSLTTPSATKRLEALRQANLRTVQADSSEAKSTPESDSEAGSDDEKLERKAA